MTSSPSIFDRSLLIKRREKIDLKDTHINFLFQETAQRLLERFHEIRGQFPMVLNLTARSSHLYQGLYHQPRLGDIVETDLSFHLAKNNLECPLKVVCQEEEIPFRAQSFDAIFSNLTLHWINDLPGTLLQLRHILKPNGLFLGCLAGGQTLHQLRQSLMEAELQLDQGASMHVSPFTDIKDMGALIQRSGFNLPVLDCDKITLHYEHTYDLLKDLKNMGETNALIHQRKTPLNKKLFQRTHDEYYQKFATKNGKIPASFDIIFFVAWAPSIHQPQPLKPGTAQVSLSDIVT